MDVFLQKGEDKNPRQTKPSRQKPLDKNPCELRQTPCKDICMYACTTKNWGVGPRCVTYFRRVPRCATKCDRGGGQNWSKIAWHTLWMAPYGGSDSFDSVGHLMEQCIKGRETVYSTEVGSQKQSFVVCCWLVGPGLLIWDRPLLFWIPCDLKSEM